MGFERLVVIKRLHQFIASEPGEAERLLREARLSSRVRSPYVVPTVDVVKTEHELCLVMEFVHGITLGRLLTLAQELKVRLEPAVVVSILGNVLRGLHAAHEATGETGRPLDLVHRDISPQNVLVGADGLARVLDFGIAKAVGKGATATNEIRGTFGYMAPEQLRSGSPVTRRVDVHAVGVLLWEALTGERLRAVSDIPELLASFAKPIDPPSSKNPALPRALDAVVLRALKTEPADRFPSAQAMLAELELALAPASTEDVVATIERVAFDELESLKELVARCERSSASMRHPNPRAIAVPTKGTLFANRYHIEDHLGSGAMGVVMGARDAVTGAALAMKFVRTDYADERAAERMLREARASLRLHGKHVVRVFHVGVEAGLVYLVMERLEGTDLRTLLAERKHLPVELAVLLVLQACEALAEAHALGIVHRDLKPANLFLTHSPEGRPHVKVLDFGIAKHAREEDGITRSLTTTSDVIGSPAYMSPEQIRAPKHVDARSDVWALAVVLYELMTGRLPFSGDTSAAILASISADRWIPLRQVLGDVPPELEHALERALAKDPRERTPSVAVLANQLVPFMTPAPRTGSPNGAGHASPTRPTAPRRRRPVPQLVAAFGSIALILTVIAAGGLLPRVRRTADGAEPSGMVTTSAPVGESSSPATPVPPPAEVDPSATSSVASQASGAGPRHVARGRPGQHPSPSPRDTRTAAKIGSPAEEAKPTPTPVSSPPPAPKLDPTADFR